MAKSIGILTSGGDCPGLNAALRAVGKAGMESFDMRVIGFRDGFRGLMQDRTIELGREELSNIVAEGGTILGTSRDKPHRMPVGNQILDMTDAMLEVYQKHHLEALVCVGGGGTQKNARRLMEKGLNIVTSHNRLIVVEIMGHRAGWLALGAGLAGGADAILIPEIPYDIESVAESIRMRTQQGKRFSIVAVAEGALSQEQARAFADARAAKEAADGRKEKEAAREKLAELDRAHRGNTLVITEQLEQLTGLESRLTILGHLQRGGTPSAADRILATTLGTRCVQLIEDQQFGVMVASRCGIGEPVPLNDVAGNRKEVSLDHPWVTTARHLGVCLGD